MENRDLQLELDKAFTILQAVVVRALDASERKDYTLAAVHMQSVLASAGHLTWLLAEATFLKR